MDVPLVIGYLSLIDIPDMQWAIMEMASVGTPDGALWTPCNAGAARRKSCPGISNAGH